MQTPDALILGGGGTLGEAWMSSLLAGLDEAEGFDARACDCYVGTSAGSIVAASLVAGLAPDARLGSLAPADAAALAQDEQRASGLRQAVGAVGELAGAAAAPFASVAFASTARGGALLRRAALRRVPPGSPLAGTARADGRAGGRALGRAPARDGGRAAERTARCVRGARRAPAASVFGGAGVVRDPGRVSRRWRQGAALMWTAARGVRPTWTPHTCPAAGTSCA